MADGWDSNTCLANYTYHTHSKCYYYIFKNDFFFSATAKLTQDNITSFYLQLVLLNKTWNRLVTAMKRTSTFIFKYSAYENNINILAHFASDQHVHSGSYLSYLHNVRNNFTQIR